MVDLEGKGFGTRAVHGAGAPDPATGAVVPPISLATTFRQEAVGKHLGYEYARSGNPTRTALETHLAALEGAAHGFAFASGLAAEDALLRLLAPGRPRAAARTTPTAARSASPSRCTRPPGLVVDTVDLTDLDAVRAAWTPATRMVWIETPSNPWLRIVDIEALSALAHEHGAVVVVDNTFATPALQQPLALGADVVVHSDHQVPRRAQRRGRRLRRRSTTTSSPSASASSRTRPAPSPARSTATSCTAAPARSSCAWSATARAPWRSPSASSSTRAVAEVLYPGLPSHPGHDIAAKQMSAFGGMISIRLAGGEAAALELCRRTELFTLAESLGAVESLIEHPGRMTHASVAGTPNEVPDDLVRLSVGIEDVDDLLADLTQALG